MSSHSSLSRFRAWFPVGWTLLAAAAILAFASTSPDAWWGRGLLVAGAGHVCRVILAGFLFGSAWAIGDALLAALAWADHARKRRRAATADLVNPRMANPVPAHPGELRLLSLRIAIGLSVLAFVLFGLAAWKLWVPSAFTALFVVQAAIWVWRGFRSGGGGAVRARWLPRTAASAWGLFGIGLALLYLVPSFARALTPPTGWDDQVYHLALPNLYLEAGGFVAQPWNIFAQQPGAMDLLFGWALALGDGSVAALIHFGLGLLAGLALLEIGARMGFRRTAWIVPALFFCHYVVGEEMGWAFNDVGMAPFLLLAWWALWSWTRRRAGSYGWALAGIAGGIVCGSKYTGALLLAGLGLCALVAGWTRGRRRKAAPRTLPLTAGIAGFGIVSFLALVPWLLKNWAFTGNPVFPMLSGTFEEWGAWNASLTDALVASQRHFYGPGRGVLDYLLLLPRVFWMSDYTPRNFAGPLSALPMIAVALSLMAPNPWRRRALVPTLVFLVLFAVWGSGFQQSRFLIPALPFLALGGVGILRWMAGGGPGSALAAVVLTAALVVNIATTGGPRWEDAASEQTMIAGKEKRDAYLAARVRSYQAFQFIKSLPESRRGSHVVFLFEPMGYYAKFPYRFSAVEASIWVEMAASSGSPASLVRRLVAHGVRLVLVNYNIRDDWLGALTDSSQPNPFGDPEILERHLNGLRILDAFLRDYGHEIYRASNTAVYELDLSGRNAPPTPGS